jgi:hypothetical protein
VLDAAVVRRNCKLMLDTARELGVGFRAHVKTHKVSSEVFLLDLVFHCCTWILLHLLSGRGPLVFGREEDE